MLTLPTAKTLLFIALSLGHHHSPVIFGTSYSENYVWTPTVSGGWAVEAKGFPSSDFTRDPAVDASINGNPASSDVPAYLRHLSQNDWKSNPRLVFDNGDRVEKCDDHILYIINAGGVNQKVFTILFPTAEN